MAEIFTVGHSTHPIGDLIAMLRSHGVEHLVDVRSIPRSRYCPQFNLDRLRQSIPTGGLEYSHIRGLGGRRKALKPEVSLNNGWRSASFRGYGDYMQTPQFATAVEWLEELARASVVAIMCAEAVPWRCHRSMLADALIVRGWSVWDIMSRSVRRPAELTSFAQVHGTEITYPSSEVPPFPVTNTHAALAS